ncbi:hypothetical protein MTBBW1_2590002 [Desulfamplus magnetovallimortis]|uniref:Uncharacterized protein n=1 Tax=Desulfamplus magnetovallimortis TaxID=1246637 RepID=A0A1W1HES8_9BACT|nr:hypothetical protein MTBBW1_2590002 [Desulfamplus magnetovallimortis]
MNGKILINTNIIRLLQAWVELYKDELLANLEIAISA